MAEPVSTVDGVEISDAVLYELRTVLMSKQLTVNAKLLMARTLTEVNTRDASRLLASPRGPRGFAHVSELDAMHDLGLRLPEVLSALGELAEAGHLETRGAAAALRFGLVYSVSVRLRMLEPLDLRASHH